MVKLKEAKIKIEELIKEKGEDMNLQIDDIIYDESCDECIVEAEHLIRK